MGWLDLYELQTPFFQFVLMDVGSDFTHVFSLYFLFSNRPYVSRRNFAHGSPSRSDQLFIKERKKHSSSVNHVRFLPASNLKNPKFR